jgi:hypothetical protein
MTFLKLWQVEIVERYGVRLVDAFSRKLDYCANVLAWGCTPRECRAGQR